MLVPTQCMSEEIERMSWTKDQLVLLLGLQRTQEMSSPALLVQLVSPQRRAPRRTCPRRILRPLMLCPRTTNIRIEAMLSLREKIILDGTLLQVLQEV